jgi:hypothetical protein
LKIRLVEPPDREDENKSRVAPQQHVLPLLAIALILVLGALLCPPWCEHSRAIMTALADSEDCS